MIMYRVTFSTIDGGEDSIYIQARDGDELEYQFLVLNISNKILDIEEVEL